MQKNQIEAHGEHFFPKRIFRGLSNKELRDLAKNEETLTEYGSPSYVGRVRSSGHTAMRMCRSDGRFVEDVPALAQIKKDIQDHHVIESNRQMGLTGSRGWSVRLWVPESYARLGLMFQSNFSPLPTDQKFPDMFVLVWPEYQGKRQIILDPESGSAYVLGSDHYGDIQDAFFALLRHRVFESGGLLLSASAKEVTVRSARSGHVQKRNVFFLGGRASGKTQLANLDLGLNAAQEEQETFLEDDVVAWWPDGQNVGIETSGHYVRTLGLMPTDHKKLFDATTSQHVVLENVSVETNGKVDFLNATLSKNGRALVSKTRLQNLPVASAFPSGLDTLFFLVRDPLMPKVARLSYAQAAISFLLEQGDSRLAPSEEEANRFFTLLKARPDLEVIALNVQSNNDSSVLSRGCQAFASPIRSILRGAVTWSMDPSLRVETPTFVDDIMDTTDATVDEWTNMDGGETLARARRARADVLDGFPGIDVEIRQALY